MRVSRYSEYQRGLHDSGANSFKHSPIVEPLGPRRRIFAIAVLMLGLFSFFLPLIKLDIPVLSKTQWSPFDITLKVYEGDLPVMGPTGRDLTSIPIMIPALYLLELIALFSVVISRSPVTLKNIAVISVCTSWLWRGDRASFEELFYGKFSYRDFSLVTRVSFGQHTVILLGVMGILWFIAANSDLDKARVEGSG